MVYKYDFLIIGAGVAGMSYALKVAREKKGKICMICKTSLEEANTSFAQGGVASVTNLKVDNFEKHIEDTMIAGDYISDRAAVEQVVRNAPARFRNSSTGASTSTARKMARSTFIVRAGIRNSESCTMPTIRVPKYSAD